MSHTSIGKNINVIGEGNNSFTTVILNSTTAVKILDANEKRVRAVIYNTDTPVVIIKEQEATVDDIAEGHPVGCGFFYETSQDGIWLGEISGMTDGADVEVWVYEYFSD